MSIINEPNNPKLKLAMAKLLPELIYISEEQEYGTENKFTNFRWTNTNNSDAWEDWFEIPEESWLYVMQLVEQKLLKLANKGHEYILWLWEETGLRKLRGELTLSKEYSSPADFRLQIDKLWELWITATFNQRATAMCQVKGMEI